MNSPQATQKSTTAICFRIRPPPDRPSRKVITRTVQVPRNFSPILLLEMVLANTNRHHTPTSLKQNRPARWRKRFLKWAWPVWRRMLRVRAARRRSQRPKCRRWSGKSRRRNLPTQLSGAPGQWRYLRAHHRPDTSGSTVRLLITMHSANRVDRKFGRRGFASPRRQLFGKPVRRISS
jgi:hypothetical protein